MAITARMGERTPCRRWPDDGCCVRHTSAHTQWPRQHHTGGRRAPLRILMRAPVGVGSLGHAPAIACMCAPHTLAHAHGISSRRPSSTVVGAPGVCAAHAPASRVYSPNTALDSVGPTAALLGGATRISPPARRPTLPLARRSTHRWGSPRSHHHRPPRGERPRPPSARGQHLTGHTHKVTPP